MKNWPTEPIAQHNLLIAALCEDLIAGERGLTGPNVTRVSEINRQINDTPRDSAIANNDAETDR